ncbi:MAG: signal peptidase II [Kiloniellaceae bacterium]
MALGLAAAVLLFDQASKWAVLELVMQPPRVIEVTGFFNLVLTYNFGISFGIFGGQGAWKPLGLSALALAVVAALLYWLWRQPERLLAVAIGLVVGGALGNVIDRLRFSAVVDFLDFHLGDWHWPAFNLADSAITVGVVLLVFDGLFGGRRNSKNGEKKVKADGNGG